MEEQWSCFSARAQISHSQASLRDSAWTLNGPCSFHIVSFSEYCAILCIELIFFCPDEVKAFLHLHVDDSSHHVLKEFREKLLGPIGSKHMVDSYEEGLDIITTKQGYYFYGENHVLQSALVGREISNMNLQSIVSPKKLKSHILLSKSSPFTRMMNRGIQALIQSQFLIYY